MRDEERAMKGHEFVWEVAETGGSWSCEAGGLSLVIRSEATGGHTWEVRRGADSPPISRGSEGTLERAMREAQDVAIASGWPEARLRQVDGSRWEVDRDPAD